MCFVFFLFLLLAGKLDYPHTDREKERQREKERNRERERKTDREIE